MKKNPQIIDTLATGFYSGKSPFAPGTCGTLAALAIHFGLTWLTPHLGTLIFSILLALSVSLIAIDVSNDALELKLYGDGEKDPGAIVIDEFAGAYIAIIGLAFNIWGYILAFFLFRFFDVFKPFPVRQAEAFPRGYGIVADDLVAGIYACLVGNLLVYVALPQSGLMP